MAFGQIVEAGLLRARRQALFAQGGQHMARVRADGSLTLGELAGSIHARSGRHGPVAAGLQRLDLLALQDRPGARPASTSSPRESPRGEWPDRRRRPATSSSCWSAADTRPGHWPPRRNCTAQFRGLHHHHGGKIITQPRAARQRRRPRQGPSRRRRVRTEADRRKTTHEPFPMARSWSLRCG